MKTLLPFTLLAAGACSEHGTTPAPFGQPITGGTMMVSADGARAVVADPDRDRIITMDLATGVALQELALDPGDEPGRLVEDAQGFVHVALRRGGAVITLDATGKQVNKRFACTEPRGLAFDSTQNLLHVACAGGELVSFGEGAAPVRSLRLERDLRDVIVQGANLVVTKFRTAEILTIDAGGNIVNRAFPPSVRRFDNGFLGGSDGLPPSQEPGSESGIVNAAASTAWRTIPLKDGSLVMTHQRKAKDTLDTEQTGGYGGNCGGGPVEDAVTIVAPGAQPRAVRRIGKGALPVDIAINPTNDKIALVMAGSRNIIVTNRSSLEESDGEENEPCEPPKPPECDGEDCGCDGGGDVPTTPPTDDAPGVPEPAPNFTGEDCGCQDDNLDGRCDETDPGEGGGGGDRLGAPTSVAWTNAGDLVIFYPEAPALVVRPGGSKLGQRRIALAGKAAFDPGRNVFHQQTAIGLACASCHPEGRDDGLTWNFAQFGSRRTQSIAGNIMDRAPYHWVGDMNDLPKLMDDVFSTRMAGGFLSENEKAALGPWMNRIPAPPAGVVNSEAAVRGKALFEASGCASCHNGDLLTNNKLVNVGTGGKFKVPSLVGVGARAPFMHDGCAKTLMDRFTTCGGGDLHGATSALSQTQLTDMVEYLESM